VSLLQANTTLITTPGTNVPDVENRYIHVWDIIRALKKVTADNYLITVTLPNNQGVRSLSTAVINNMRQAVKTSLYNFQDLGMLQNVALYENVIFVGVDPQNPNFMKVTVPAQIIPQINGMNANIFIFSTTQTVFQPLN
jgi:hypothetical protein